MAEPAHLTAATGTLELHQEPSALFLTAPGWVALAMLIVIGIILWQKVPAMIARALDTKIAGIKKQIDEAAKLRSEAEALLAEATARNAASANDAAEIVAHAEREAAALRAKAEADAAELIKRRAKMAEDKIAAAERAAISAVRAKAADTATKAAAAIIAEKHGADADKPLVDKTIAGLNRLN